MRSPVTRAGRLVPVLAAGLLLGACAGAGDPGPALTVDDDARLRTAAPDGFAIGSSVAGGGHNVAAGWPDPFTDDEDYRAFLTEEVSSLTPENQLKWEFLRPSQDEYDFAGSDAVVEFAQENGQVVRGHTLLWHSQNPAWLEEGDFSADELRGMLRDHVMTVVGRYAGQIEQWDVANEVIDDDGNLRLEENIFIRELGPEIIGEAFHWAHEADPDAALFINDYNVEWIGPKSDAYYELVQELLADGVPIDGFGIQGHLSTQYPFPGDMTDNLRRFADLDLQLAITEADVRIVLPADGVATEEQLDEQAEYYRGMLDACLAVDACASFTLWSPLDAYSWVPYFFEGEGAAGVLDDDVARKPAYVELLSALDAARR